jgi:hypothetical protein
VIEDANALLNDLYGHCADVEHLVGVCDIPTRDGQYERVAIVRLVLKENGKLRPWTQRVVYKRAVEVATGVEMFVLYSPDEPMNPWLATEWVESYNEFVATANRLDLFIFEIYQPSLKRACFVCHGEVRNSGEWPLTPEEYQAILSGEREAPPLNTSGRGNA